MEFKKGSGRQFKAIFGNPPFALKAKNGGSPKLLWDKFSDSSIAMADEVYYVTPLLWNRRADWLNRKLRGKLYYVDLSTGEEFKVYSPICSWLFKHKRNEGDIKITLRHGKEINIKQFTDLLYIPYDSDNTLTIHHKGWNKKPMGFRANNTIPYDYIKREKTAEYNQPVYYSSRHNLYWTTPELKAKYPGTLIPKIIVGFITDNSPYFDREGELLTSANHAYYISDSIENMEIRMEQLTSNFAKTWWRTGRQGFGGGKTSIHCYHKAMRAFPDIPLNCRTDGEIYDYMGLDSDEIDTCERHAAVVTKSESDRNAKYSKDLLTNAERQGENDE